MMADAVQATPSYYLQAYEFQYNANLDTLMAALADKTNLAWTKRDKESTGEYLRASSPTLGVLRIFTIDSKFTVDILLKNPEATQSKWIDNVNLFLDNLKELGATEIKATTSLY
ncbi:MAG: hypothetical protein NTX49_04350 [Chlamydiae bacterium]|nr:hypothetical protein [Chlamydiota bacterium]